MTVTAESIGQKIAEAMRDAGAKPAHVAAALDIGVSTLHRYVRGETDPSYRHIVQLAQFLDKPIDWFVGEAAA